MSDNEHGSTNVRMANIPDEIFEHHIWKYFAFNRWIRVFSLVCKRWKRICEESTVDPKQIQIHNKNGYEGAKLLKIVQKYQPTILRLKLEFANDLFLVHRMCEVSKRLHTLVLECRESKKDFDMYVKPIKNITTLALAVRASQNFWQNLQIIFPNLQRLQVEEPNELFNIKVDHFTLVHSGHMDFNALDPDVAVIQKDKVIVTKLLGSNSTNSRELTSEEYFQYFGETELLAALKERDFHEAKQLLLGSSTETLEYEKALYESYLCYEYPSPISVRVFDLKEYWSTFINSEFGYKMFIRTNIIPMPTSEKFIALSRFKNIKGALRELSKLDDTTLTSESVRTAFLKIFLPNATKAQIHQKRVIENVKKIIRYVDIQYISEKDFNKIVDLRDWSNHYAITTNARICYAMVSAGCKILAHDFRQLNRQEDVGFILDLIVEQHPSKLFDTLIYFPFNKLKSVVDKHNISLTIEKGGISFFNKRIELVLMTEESSHLVDQELNEYKHLVYHMDSSGRTPLLVALECPSKKVWRIVKKLLELGADPTVHRGDKLSPLGLTLLGSFFHLYNNELVNILNILVEYGADVNAPCLYKERMCSPLMSAAAIKYMESDIIILLVTLGARTDYVDEAGRTIMDCIINNKNDIYSKRYREEILTHIININ